MRTVVLFLLAACGQTVKSMPDAADTIELDAPPPPTIDAPAGLGAFGAPTAVTEINAMLLNDDDVSLTEDQLELFFSSTRAGGIGGDDIWVAKRASRSAPWVAPVNVAELNSIDSEQHPHISADGLTMYLASTRPGGPGSTDIYIAARATRSAPWSTPSVVAELSSVASDQSAKPDPTGLMIIVDSNRSGASARDLYLSTRATTQARWGIPATIAAVNTAENEQDGMLADGGLALYYTYRGDIHVATRPSATAEFAAGNPVPGVNHTTAADLDPWISEDQRTIYFASKRGGADDDIFMATR